MSQDNRITILTQALSLFAARGYDAVGVQEIAAAAGVTKPTLYHYFGSKSGLLDTLLADYFDPLLVDLEKACVYRRDLPLTLQTVVEVYFRFARLYPVFYRMQLAMYFAPPESEPAQAIRRYSTRQHVLIERMFEQAAEQHGNMRGRHFRYAVTLRGMIDTYISLILDGHIQFNDENLHLAVHQFMHGIYS